MELYQEWTTASDERQVEIWHEMLKLYAASATRSACLGRPATGGARRHRNVPKEAIFNYEPHGQFGIYLLDTFWYDQ